MPILPGIVASSIRTSGSSYDTDAQAFFTALETDASPVTLNSTQKSAINTLTLGLKSLGVWNNMKFFYPMIGGTAASHKYNLKDPRDLDAAYRITWAASPVHSANGVVFNGGNYGDTHFIPFTGLSVDANGVIGYYSRTNTIEAAIEIGALDSGDVGFFLGLYFSGTSGTRSALNGSIRYNSNTQSNTTGLFTAVRDDATNISAYRNGGLLAQQAAATSNRESTVSLYLGGFNNNGTLGQPSTKECAIAFVFDGTMNSTVNTNLYNLIQNYQTALSRNV